MLEEGMEESLTAVFGHQGVGDFVGEVRRIMRDKVGHFSIFSVAPTGLDRIEFRCIRRKVCDMQACAIDRLEETGGFAVATPAIPDQQQGALQMAVELLHKGKASLSCEIGGRDRKIEPQALALGGDGECGGHGEAIVAIPARVDGGLALRGPRPAHSGLAHEAGLIQQDQRAAFTPGFF